MKHVAKLDSDGIYQGVLAIEDEDLKPDHVEVPEDCDLALGRYRWDGSTFVPLARGLTK